MLSLNGTTRIFLKTGATDGRLGMDGLFAKVKDEMAQNPTCGFYYGFCNRAKNRLRVLSFDGSGLTLFIKRLERSTFRWPKDGNSEIDPMVFQALLCGLEVQERRGWYRHPRPGSTPAPQATTQPSGSPLSAAALSSAA